MDNNTNGRGAPQREGRRPARAKKAGMSTAAKVGIAILASVLIALWGINITTDLVGILQPSNEVEITIPSGLSSTEIANLLKEEGVIEHPLVFVAYAKLQGKLGSFKAGEYVLNSNMAYGDIYVELAKGNSNQDSTVSITFYEGRTLLEIAQLLEQGGVCSADDFIAYLDSEEFEYDFADSIPDDERFRRMEGYLFPDTYEFFKGDNVSRVAKKFLDRFDEMFTDEMYARMRELDMTLDEVVTLASIIQEECSDINEMARVSSVFHNRLNRPSEYPKLQSDVTIFYVNDNIIPFMESVNQPLYDSYNTYVCSGLPIGPICSPGQAALRAALNPEDTNYYYFISDRSGNFMYATTFAQHEDNIRKAGI